MGEEHLTSTDLELLSQDILFNNGYKCILLNETKLGPNKTQLPQLDSEIDYGLADIRSITEKWRENYSKLH